MAWVASIAHRVTRPSVLRHLRLERDLATGRPRACPAKRGSSGEAYPSVPPAMVSSFGTRNWWSLVVGVVPRGGFVPLTRFASSVRIIYCRDSLRPGAIASAQALPGEMGRSFNKVGRQQATISTATVDALGKAAKVCVTSDGLRQCKSAAQKPAPIGPTAALRRGEEIVCEHHNKG
jgi:hypothetical protein